MSVLARRASWRAGLQRACGHAARAFSSDSSIIEETEFKDVVRIRGQIYTKSAEAFKVQRKKWKAQMAELSRQKLAEVAAEEEARQKAEEEERKKVERQKIERRKEHIRQRIVRVRRHEAAVQAQKDLGQRLRAEAAERLADLNAARRERQLILAQAVEADSKLWYEPGQDISEGIFYQTGGSTGYTTRSGALLSRFETDIRHVDEEMYRPIHTPEQVLEVRKMREMGVLDSDSFHEGVLSAAEIEELGRGAATAAEPAYTSPPPNKMLEDIFAKYGHLHDQLDDMSEEELEALLLEMFDGVPGALENAEGELLLPGDGDDAAAQRETRGNRVREDPRLAVWESERELYRTEYADWDEEDMLRELHTIALERILAKNPNAEDTRKASDEALLQAQRWFEHGAENEQQEIDLSKNGWFTLDGPGRQRRSLLQTTLKDRKIKQITSNSSNFSGVKRRPPAAQKSGRTSSLQSFFQDTEDKPKKG